MKRITTLCILICGTIAAFSQSLPIRDAAELRNYALSIASNGSRSVYSTSIDWTWNQTFSYTNITGAKNGETLLDGLISAPFTYRLLNTNDQINSYLWLYDDQKIDEWGDHDLLFFGYASYAPGGQAKYQVWMQNIPLLMLTNVDTAQVLVVNPDGTTGYTYKLDVVNGHPMFQPWMAGSPNGILVIKYNDGSLVKYDLSKPDPSVVSGLTESGNSWKIDGHYVVRTSSPNCAVKIIELWNRPSVYLNASVDTMVTLDVVGVYQDNQGNAVYERPISIEIDTVSTGQHNSIINYDTANPTKVVFPAGEYRIRFGWKNFGQPYNLYIPIPTSDGGGGKG